MDPSTDSLLRSALIALLASAIVAAAATPVVRFFATRAGVVVPPGGRHVHQRPIPRLGGLAVMVAFAVAVAICAALVKALESQLWDRPGQVVGIAVGGLVMCLLGAADDIRGLGAKTKLLVQVLTACGAFACGFRIESIFLPWLGSLPMGVFALPITVLWITGIVNALNLIDGLDGLAAGVAFVACATNLVVGSINGDLLVVVFSAGLGGAILGFLLYNFNPASIFMGDSGSMFLGYLLATSSMLGASVKSATTVALLVPILAMGVPIIDTLFAMLRRIVERRPIFAPDQSHIHHRLLDIGVTHRRAVLLIYAFSGLLAITAIVVATGRDWQVGASLVLMSALAVTLIRFVGYSDYLRLRRRRQTRIESRSLRQLRVASRHLIHSLHQNSSQVGIPTDALNTFAAEAALNELNLAIRESGSTQTGLTFGWQRRQSQAPRFEGQRCTHDFAIEAEDGKHYELRAQWDIDLPQAEGQADVLFELLFDVLTHAIGGLDKTTSGDANAASEPS